MPATESPAVNAQIIDAMTATSTGVIGEAPAFAMGMVFQTAAQAVAQTMQNQATTQQGMQQVGVAVVSTAVSRIMATPHPTPAPPIVKVRVAPESGTPNTSQAAKDISKAQDDLKSAQHELQSLKRELKAAQEKLTSAQAEIAGE